MLIEDQRLLHEDLERLEQAISDRILGDPKNVSGSLLPPLSFSNRRNRFEIV